MEQKIKILRDPTIEHKEIVIRRKDDKQVDVGDQPAVYGIMAPLVTINEKVIDKNDLISFELDLTGFVPTVRVEFQDNFRVMEKYDTRNQDIFMNVQIIPQFDGTYKKINLDFYIYDKRVSGRIIKLAGSYKVKDFINNRYEGLGEVSTFELADKISKETGLGLASNITATQDKSWVYCDYRSYADVLRNRIPFSQTDDETLLDCWVDCWENIVLVNKQTKLSEQEDLKDKESYIWVKGNVEDLENSPNKKPELLPRELSNSPGMGASELRILDYKIINKAGTPVSGGTDRVYSMYEMSKGEYTDTLLIDKDTKEDHYKVFEYTGEVYGDYNYIKSKHFRRTKLQKLALETLQITLGMPVFGLYRGMKVEVLLMDIDDEQTHIDNMLDKFGHLNPTDIKTPDTNNFNEMASRQNINKSLSGQYYIDGNILQYKDNNWQNKYNLVRPSDQKPELIKTE